MRGSAPGRPGAVWKEPFVHFLIFGAAVFAADAAWQRVSDKREATIVIETEELQRRAALFAAESQRTPDDDDLKALLYQMVEEEALVREAKALGLDRGDTIVRRRLAQKMRFMLEDTRPVEPPAREEVCALVEAEPARFTLPETRSFQHIYFNPDTSGENGAMVRAEAAQARAPDTDWTSLGDPFLLRRSYDNVSSRDVAEVFGERFADAVFAPETAGPAAGGAFAGPVESVYGLHLVRLTDMRPEVPRDCDAAFDDAAAILTERERETANRAARETLLSRYRVEVVDADAP